MRNISDLIFQANSIFVSEPCGEVTCDGILAALATLEAASAVRSKRGPAEDFTPADAKEVAQYLAPAEDDLRLTVTDVYRDLYGREPSTAEARTVADAMREASWLPYRSAGRTLWRRRNPTVDGLLGLDNAPEIDRKVRAWALEQPYFKITAAEVFAAVFSRKATIVESKATGTILRSMGFSARKTNGRTVFSKLG